MLARDHHHLLEVTSSYLLHDIPQHDLFSLQPARERETSTRKIAVFM